MSTERLAAQYQRRVVLRRLWKTAGWWRNSDGLPLGDGPADIMDAALEDINQAYQDSWGRPASPEEIQAVFNFCFPKRGSGGGPGGRGSYAKSSAHEKQTGDGSEVWIGFKIPPELAKGFPPLGDQDRSPPHVTFLYVGDVPKDRQAVFVDTVRRALADWARPTMAVYRDVTYFDHPAEGRRVAVLPVRFDDDMADVRRRLCSALEDQGFTVDDRFPVYQPHTTLAYLDSLEALYEGDLPSGRWEVAEAEIWGLPKVHKVPLGRQGKEAHVLIADDGANEREFYVPDGSIPLLLTSEFEAAVREAGEQRTRIPVSRVASDKPRADAMKRQKKAGCDPSGAPDEMQVIDFVRGYKQITGVRRIPIAKVTDPRTKQTEIVTGLEEVKKRKLMIKGKPYLSTKEMKALFADEVVVEEKVDGHPVIIIYGGYTFFCESLKIQHTVEYDACPYSQMGWPDMTVVYEILEGEVPPPYQRGQGGRNWLSRSDKEAVCQMVGAPLVPLVFKGRVRPEDVPAMADRTSSFGRGSAEGVVIKNLHKGVFGKFINLEFQRSISDEALWGQVHPMQRGKKNIRRRAHGRGR